MAEHADTQAVRDALANLRHNMTGSAKDWSAGRIEAGVYGILVGWSGPDADDPDDHSPTLRQRVTKLGLPVESADEIERHRAAIASVPDLLDDLDRLRVHGSPGVMHQVDRAFYDLAIQERDAARAVVARQREVIRRYEQTSIDAHDRIVRVLKLLTWEDGTERDEIDRAEILDALNGTALEPVQAVLGEVATEILGVDTKWGEQNHPLVDPVLVDRGAERMAEEYEIPTEQRAKFLCQLAAERGTSTFAGILVEEVAEFVAALGDPGKSRDELIQVAAVAITAILSIDRAQKKEHPDV